MGGGKVCYWRWWSKAKFSGFHTPLSSRSKGKGRPSGFPSQESFTHKLHTAHPIVIFFSNYIHFLKKYNTMLNTRTVNNGKYSMILKSQKSLAEPRKEIKDDLHGEKLPVLLLSLVCDRSALWWKAFRPPPLGQALLKPFLGLLLRQAGLGRDEAQRGGVGVLVDLVEVVLQDLHLVLRGAAGTLCRHGPGAPVDLSFLQEFQETSIMGVCI